MNIVLQTRERTLVSLSSEEVMAISNAINEVCNGVAISDWEFQTRLGFDRKFLQTVLSGLVGTVGQELRSNEAVNVWADNSSVMLRSITAFGDPVEMGENEIEEFSSRLKAAIADSL